MQERSVVEIAGRVAVSQQDPARGHQAFDADRAPGVEFAGADAHFGAKTVAIPIGKACAGIDEHPCCVDAAKKPFGGRVVLRDDAFGVPAAMLSDVGQRRVQVGHHAQVHFRGAVLPVEVGIVGVHDHAGGFERRLERWWRKGQQRGTRVGLMLVDIDYFRRFDQSCGHFAAERALRAIAQSIQGLRSTRECFLARMDDDGFGVIMRDASGDALQQLAEEIREAVGRLHVQHPDSPIASELTVTIAGRVLQPAEGHGADAAFEQVRADLNHLKRCNRNRIWIEESYLPSELPDKVTPLRRQQTPS